MNSGRPVLDEAACFAAAEPLLLVSANTAAARRSGLRSLTPLLDTLFLLLFTLLATSESRSEDDLELLRIRLPQVERAPAGNVGPTPKLVLEVAPDGSFGLAGEERRYRRPAELESRLSALLGDSLAEETAVEILGDRAAPHGAVVRLLQGLRLRGFVSIDLVATGDAEEPR